jgi:hypothetical protein
MEINISTEQLKSKLGGFVDEQGVNRKLNDLGIYDNSNSFYIISIYNS